MLLILSKTTHAPLAATVTAFSTYFTGLCIYASRVRCVLSPRPRDRQATHFSSTTRLVTRSRMGQARLSKWVDLAVQRGYRTLNGERRRKVMLLKSKVPAAGRRALPERIHDAHTIHLSRLLHVLREEHAAAGLHGGPQDQSIPERELVKTMQVNGSQ